MELSVGTKLFIPYHHYGDEYDEDDDPVNRIVTIDRIARFDWSGPYKSTILFTDVGKCVAYHFTPTPTQSFTGWCSQHRSDREVCGPDEIVFFDLIYTASSSIRPLRIVTSEIELCIKNHKQKQMEIETQIQKLQLLEQDQAKMNEYFKCGCRRAQLIH
jgi:hypothetical protein